MNVSYTLFTYLVVYVTPVTVMLAAYVRIAHELRQACRGAQSGSLRELESPYDDVSGGGGNGRSVDECWTARGGPTGSETVTTTTTTTTATATASSAASASERLRRLRDKRVIVRMLVAIVLLFAVSWFPFFTVQVNAFDYNTD